MTSVKRQNDQVSTSSIILHDLSYLFLHQVFVGLLNRLRLGRCSEEDSALLKATKANAARSDPHPLCGW